MDIGEAKDFLVQQTVEQAALENIPVSDLERRMMYFTETGEMSEDPLALNEAFEAESNTDDYENKIGKLMRHAYWRLKKENPQSAARWKQAIKNLSTEDHYILVLWNAGSSERPPHDALRLFGTALALVVAGVAVMVGFIYVSERYGIHWPDRPNHPSSTHRSTPVWLGRGVLGVIALTYAYYVVLPWIIGRPAPSLLQLAVKLLVRRNSTIQ